MNFFGLFLKKINKIYANVIVFLFLGLKVIFFWKCGKQQINYKR